LNLFLAHIKDEFGKIQMDRLGFAIVALFLRREETE
jgi:hypothetical protein